MTRNPHLRGLVPMHPGEWLREEVLPAVGRPKAEIARLLGISRQHLYDILDERKPVTPATALRLGKLLGNGAEFWVDLQRSYDLAEAEKTLAKALKGIPTIVAA
jgi:addiction module HigA family antidote